MIDEDGLRGVTSNPAIFEKAISGSGDYADEIARLRSAGLDDPKAIYERLAIRDIRDAADVLRPVHDESDGRDGYVSLEVSPALADDTEGTIAEARRLWGAVERENLMVKVPATPAGIPAIRSLIGNGINVNVTLLFSQDAYEQVAEAYLAGLEDLRARGGDVSRVASVASFFVSRVDTETDRRLPEGHPLRGKAAVANAKLAYEQFQKRFSGQRWEALAAQGARLQRPLWASTSTKNPAYSPTLYVDELVGRHTVNTLAQASVDALRNHSGVRPDTVTEDLDGARAVMAGLAEAGVDFDDVTATLEREGVATFSSSFHDALDTLGKKARELAS
jgi:transaldolase/glucose-6-phosphate isomerase